MNNPKDSNAESSSEDSPRGNIFEGFTIEDLENGYPFFKKDFRPSFRLTKSFSKHYWNLPTTLLLP